MRFIPFEERKLGEWKDTLFFSKKAEFKSRDASWQQLARERDNFLKSGYRKSYGRFNDIWIADPRI